jgi:hypothetical protein
MLFSRITISNSLLRKLPASFCNQADIYRDVGMYDRVVIQDILKEIAQTQQVDLNAKQRFKGKLSLMDLLEIADDQWSSSTRLMR